MSIKATIGSEGQRYRVRTAEERELAFLRAERHSRLVGMLRKVLPVVAVVVLASYFVSTQLSVTVGDMTASISGIEIADGNLRMVNPKLKGADKKNGTYVVGADYADQDIKNPKMIKLHALKAELASGSGGWSRMQATRGVFNSQSERLVMQDKITVATSSGVTGDLSHATLDMQTQTLRSHRPVVFHLTNGTVRANALTYRSADSTLTFRGKVRVHMVKKPKDGKKAASPVAGAALAPATETVQGAEVAPVILPPLPQPVEPQ